MNNGVFYKIELIQFDDASSPKNVEFMYGAMDQLYNLTAAFGPWSQTLNIVALNVTRTRRLPYVFSGAAGGGSFVGFNHSVGLTVNGAKRFLPCLQLFKARGATTAAVLEVSAYTSACARDSD